MHWLDNQWRFSTIRCYRPPLPLYCWPYSIPFLHSDMQFSVTCQLLLQIQLCDVLKREFLRLDTFCFLAAPDLPKLQSRDNRDACGPARTLLPCSMGDMSWQGGNNSLCLADTPLQSFQVSCLQGNTEQTCIFLLGTANTSSSRTESHRHLTTF